MVASTIYTIEIDQDNDLLLIARRWYSKERMGNLTEAALRDTRQHDAVIHFLEKCIKHKVIVHKAIKTAELLGDNDAD